LLGFSPAELVAAEMVGGAKKRTPLPPGHPLRDATRASCLAILRR
jgi:hypothetical protein